MDAIYRSIWDGGTTIETYCSFTPESRIVRDIEISDNVNGLNVLDREEINVNGETIEVWDLGKFTDKWTDTECKCESDNDTETLINSILEANDFSEVFDIIRAWSRKPVANRVAEFLRKNNACIIEE